MKLLKRFLIILCAMVILVPGVAVMAAPARDNGDDIVSYLDDDLPAGYEKIFKRIAQVLKPILADAYNLILGLGFGLLTIAGVVAAVSYGLFKDSDLVKENKRWLQRIFLATALLGSVFAFCGIITRIRIGG